MRKDALRSVQQGSVRRNTRIVRVIADKVQVDEMPHRWPAVGAGPGVVHVRHVVDDLPHARPVEGRADHHGGPASPRREHQPDARRPKQPRFSGGFLAQHEDQLLDILRKNNYRHV